MIDVDEETDIPDLLGKVKAELDLRWATRQQYAEERAAALREVDKLKLEIQGYQVGDGYEKGHEHGSSVAARERAERNRLQAVVDKAGQALTRIADQDRWEQTPPSLLERIELVEDRLREARAERDELRAHGVARDIGEANEQLRAELDALKSGRHVSVDMRDYVLTGEAIGDNPEWFHEVFVSARDVSTIIRDWCVANGIPVSDESVSGSASTAEEKP
jgi:hypothetical protein